MSHRGYTRHVSFFNVFPRLHRTCLLSHRGFCSGDNLSVSLFAGLNSLSNATLDSTLFQMPRWTPLSSKRHVGLRSLSNSILDSAFRPSANHAGMNYFLSAPHTGNNSFSTRSSPRWTQLSFTVDGRALSCCQSSCWVLVYFRRSCAKLERNIQGSGCHTRLPTLFATSLRC